MTTARADLVMETTATIGVGPITLLGAVDGFFSFAESFSDGDVLFYCQRQKGGAREVVKGTFTAPNILSRDEIKRSSVPGDPTAPVNWGDGTRIVYHCLPADEVLFREDALSEIATFLIADSHLSEIAALGEAAQDDSLENLGGLAIGIALLKAATAAAARGTLGLGSAAVLTTGTAAGNALALDGAGKIPAVPGDQLSSLPGHTHAVLVYGGYTGGSNSKILRYASAGALTAASKSDTPDLLTHLFARGSDGVLYGRGSLRVPFTGVVAGQRYWLGATGDLVTAPPTPISSPFTSQVEIGIGMDTGFLYFDALLPVGGATGFSEEVALYLGAGGTLRLR